MDTSSVHRTNRRTAVRCRHSVGTFANDEEGYVIFRFKWSLSGFPEIHLVDPRVKQTRKPNIYRQSTAMFMGERVGECIVCECVAGDKQQHDSTTGGRTATMLARQWPRQSRGLHHTARIHRHTCARDGAHDCRRWWRHGHQRWSTHRTMCLYRQRLVVARLGARQSTKCMFLCLRNSQNHPCS